MILFPAIDLKNGQCVRLEQGDMARATVFNLDPAAQATRLAYWQAVLAELDAIPVDQLSEEEQVNAAVLRTSLAAFVADGRYRGWEMPLNADRNRCACPGDVNRFIARSRCRVG